MYTSTVLFVVLFSGLSQQLSDTDHGNLLKQRHGVIQARQFGGPDLSFCYGETAICSEGNDLFDKCSAFEEQADPTQWYQCLCGNGYVEADNECQWCDEAYGISDTDLSDLNTSQCNKYNGGTIAPLPASVLAAVSAFNASYTGVISGAATGGSGAAATASGGEGTAAGSASATPKTTSSTPRNTQSNSKSASSVSHTATVVQTLNGGSPGTLTAAPTSTQGSGETSSSSSTGQSGSGTGGAQGWNTGVAVVFSVIAVGFSVLCLL